MGQPCFFPEPGVVSAVEGAAAFAGHPDVAYLEPSVKAGGRIGPIDCHPARAGVVITTGATREATVRLAETVVESVVVSISKDGTI